MKGMFVEYCEISAFRWLFLIVINTVFDIGMGQMVFILKFLYTVDTLTN